jgi:hypothetical protein
MSGSSEFPSSDTAISSESAANERELTGSYLRHVLFFGMGRERAGAHGLNLQVSVFGRGPVKGSSCGRNSTALQVPSGA